MDKYTWVDIGSSFLPDEVTAAFLFAQMERCDEITNKRLSLWNEYDQARVALELENKLARPRVTEGCLHNAHMYYVLLGESIDRGKLISMLEGHEVNAVFHYVPLHKSPAGKKYGRVVGSMENTERLSARLIRLPMWLGLDIKFVSDIFSSCVDALHESNS